jgi:hypothetical protein
MNGASIPMCRALLKLPCACPVPILYLSKDLRLSVLAVILSASFEREEPVLSVVEGIPTNPNPPQPSTPFSHKTPAHSPLLIAEAKKTPCPPVKNPSKSACQAPRRPKIPITPTPSTTSPTKIVGIVVMLRLIQLIYGSNSSNPASLPYPLRQHIVNDSLQIC